MKQYKLGPNGGIVTSLNLFATKFDKVISLIEKAGEKHKLCIIDTPGWLSLVIRSALN
jgi:GPN-loop GTPase